MGEIRRGKEVLVVTGTMMQSVSIETIESLKGLRDFRDACLEKALWKSLFRKSSLKELTSREINLEGLRNKFINEVCGVPGTMEALHGVESGGQHVIIKHVSLKKWIEMLHISSIWQAFYLH